MGAIRDLFTRWRGCFAARMGSYDVQEWELRAMDSLIAEAMPLPPEVHKKVTGFQALTEACALVHRPGSYAYSIRRWHRMFALATTILLPINIVVFECVTGPFP
jgi:hypothetical protein